MFYSFIDSASHGGDTASFGDNMSQHHQVRNVASESDLVNNKAGGGSGGGNGGKSILIKDAVSENQQLSRGAGGPPNLIRKGYDGDGQSSISGCNVNDVTDELSSISNGLNNKMLPASTPIRASMMKI